MSHLRGSLVDLPLVTDMNVAGVPVRLYRPVDDAKPGPLVVYFHGGGWVHGSLDKHEALCRDMAHRTTASVLAVEYRKAPEHPYPAALDDAWQVVLTMLTHPVDTGTDPLRVAVWGDSAGANLAAVVSRRARDAELSLCHQLLVCPATDAAMTSASYAEFATGHGMTASDMAWYYAQYRAGSVPDNEPDLSPLHLEDKRNLAPATIVTAENDVLRDEGEEYGRQLMTAGVDVSMRRFPGIHGFFGLPGLFDHAEGARVFAARRLRAALHGPDSPH
ncbi:alpha/beta hydrolase [Streptomyces kanamyceticus]|uniref:alpha/beta hydrolase n=1 Tax=Streptomyces kanamyceticus TaxID=1967 RepID=UPI0037DD5323